MVELVDTRDLKSLDSNIVPVQVRPRVPSFYSNNEIPPFRNKIYHLKRAKNNVENQDLEHYFPKIKFKMFAKRIKLNTAFTIQFIVKKIQERDKLKI